MRPYIWVGLTVCCQAGNARGGSKVKAQLKEDARYRNTKHTAQHNNAMKSSHVWTAQGACKHWYALLQLAHYSNPLAWYKWTETQPNVHVCKSLKTPNKLRRNCTEFVMQKLYPA